MDIYYYYKIEEFEKKNEKKRSLNKKDFEICVIVYYVWFG